MRAIEIDLLGQKRLLCFSVGATLAVKDVFGGLDAWGKRLGAKKEIDRFSALLKMAEILSEAGSRYAAAAGLGKEYAPLKADGLLDALDPYELADLQQAVIDAIRAGQARTVGAKPPKNA